MYELPRAKFIYQHKILSYNSERNFHISIEKLKFLMNQNIHNCENVKNKKNIKWYILNLSPIPNWNIKKSHIKKSLKRLYLKSISNFMCHYFFSAQFKDNLLFWICKFFSKAHVYYSLALYTYNLSVSVSVCDHITCKFCCLGKSLRFSRIKYSHIFWWYGAKLNHQQNYLKFDRSKKNYRHDIFMKHTFTFTHIHIHRHAHKTSKGI